MNLDAIPSSPDAPRVVPTLKFTYAGVDRTLAKHPVIQQKYKRGLLTDEQIRLAPWYLRLQHRDEKTGVEKERAFKLCRTKEDEAIREAKDFLKNREQRPNEFAAFLAQQDARRGLTLQQLAEDWFAAGLPFSKTHPRKPAAAEKLRKHTTRALRFWGDKTAAAVTPSAHADFVVWRRQLVADREKARAGAAVPSATLGTRTADLELAALSCLCQWAVSLERIPKNPFEQRERFTDPEAITHCHEAMPSGDDEYHRVLTHFFALPETRPPEATPAQLAADLEQWRARVVVGAWHAFTALSGLRPGEHQWLERQSAADKFPADLRAAAPGLIYPMPDGSRRMKVRRTKGGQNPAIVIHPALQDFLNHYLPWLADNFPLEAGSAMVGQGHALFPGLTGEGKLNGYLARACASVKIKHLKPHGFGRAYYVRVRRSQGADDSTIAAELGQKSDGALIRSVYGDPQDPVGGNLHDWLPAEGHPAWTMLQQATIPNLIAL